MNLFTPTASEFPQKVYLETTTRCNLRCRMCVKYAQGSCIEEDDLDMSLFERLLPSLVHTGFLVLNGIGEPLLHPQLPAMIARAREVMPDNGIIGFQSNGMLLNEPLVKTLLRAGLDTVCLSLDSLEPLHKGEHQRTPVEKAIKMLGQAAAQHERALSIGLEVVLQRKSLHQLPLIIDWAHQRGVEYIIASHLFSYDGAMEDESLFSPCSTGATALFEKWGQKARDQGLNLADLPTIHLRFTKNAADQQLLAMGVAMQQEAREHDINLHFPNLLKYTQNKVENVASIWQQSLARAHQLGIRLTLPPLQAPATAQRLCPFMEDQAVFIATNGDVMPCHFLWHTYACMVNQSAVQVQARSFGNLRDNTLEQIWHDPAYAAFRQEAQGSDYAPCWSCSSGPCPDLVNANLLDIHDCYGTQVPCGHCMWSIGWTRCL